MQLYTQIITLLFSFLFGIIFSIELKLNHKFIYQNNKIYKIITTFLFVLINVLLYFIGLKKINNGILHMYGLISIMIGYIFEIYVEKFLSSFVAIKYKKWYNSNYRVGVAYV